MSSRSSSYSSSSSSSAQVPLYRGSMLAVEQELKCPVCRGTNIVEDHSSGDAVCHTCGAVVDEHLIDTEREWREFESDTSTQLRSRVGGPVDSLTGELQMQMSKPDAKHKSLARAQMRESQRETEYLRDAFKQVDELGQRMELPDRYMHRAKELLKELNDRSLLKAGKTMLLFIAAAVYIACRQDSVPRQFKEIAKLLPREAEIDWRDISKRYKYIIEKLKLDMSQKTVTAEDLVARFVNRLRLPTFIEAAAKEVAKRSNDLALTAGKTPSTVASASVYMLMLMLPEQQRVPLVDIATIAQITEQTIRNCLRDLHQNKDQLLPDGFAQRLQQHLATSAPAAPAAAAASASSSSTSSSASGGQQQVAQSK